MTTEQLKRLEQGPGGFLRHLFFPEKSISMPALPGNKDGITIHSEHRVSFADRLRILFGGGLYVVSLVACKESPKAVIANTAIMAIPPFSRKIETTNQPELPFK